MKIKIQIHKVRASGMVEIENESVEDAKKKALEIARNHAVALNEPAEDFIAVIERAVSKIKK